AADPAARPLPGELEPQLVGSAQLPFERHRAARHLAVDVRREPYLLAPVAVTPQRQRDIAAHALHAPGDAARLGHVRRHRRREAVVGPLARALDEQPGALVLDQAVGLGPRAVVLVDAVDPGVPPHGPAARGPDE